MINIQMTQGQLDHHDPGTERGLSSSQCRVIKGKGPASCASFSRKESENPHMGAGEDAEWTEHKTGKEKQDCVVSGLKSSELKP